MLSQRRGPPWLKSPPFWQTKWFFFSKYFSQKSFLEAVGCLKISSNSPKKIKFYWINFIPFNFWSRTSPIGAKARHFDILNDFFLLKNVNHINFGCRKLTAISRPGGSELYRLASNKPKSQKRGKPLQDYVSAIANPLYIDLIHQLASSVSRRQRPWNKKRGEVFQIGCVNPQGRGAIFFPSFIFA